MSYAQIRNASRAEVILVSATAQGEGDQLEGDQGEGEKIAFPEGYRSTCASYPGALFGPGIQTR